MSFNNLNQHCFSAMGGEFSLSCYPQPNLSFQDTQKLFLQAEKEVQRVEDLLTDFRPSPFQKINTQAGKSPVEVDEETWSIIEESLRLSTETQGQFDMSYASVGILYRQAKQEKKTIDEKEVKRRKQWVDYRKIVCDREKRTIYLPHPEMRISLGGIGKGYAVDCAYELLKKEGMINFMVNGSGDIRVDAHHEAPRPWRVGIQNPFTSNKNQFVGFLALKQGAFSTSGNYKNNLFKISHRHHIVNPRKGDCMNEVVSASLFTDKSMRGDALATTCLTLSTSRALKFIEQQDILGILIDRHGKVHLSQKAQKAHGGIQC